ncbi:MAG: cyclic nucleotide-binding domain-containing protein [Pseudomonadota bacterium]
MMSESSKGPTRAELRKNLKALKIILVEKPLDLDARVRIARTLRLLGKPRDAIQHYRAVARYLALAGQPLQAIAVLKELLQIDPDHQETLLFLAKLYARTRGAIVSNVGRIAVPIDDGHMPGTVAGGWPMTSTGVWRAIRPRDSQELLREASADEVGVEDLDAAIEVDEDDIAEQLDTLDALDAIDIPDSQIEEVEPVERTDPDAKPPEFAERDDAFEILGEPSEGELVLPKVPLFSSLSQRAFIDLATAMTPHQAATGATIFAMGDPGDSVFVISRGRVRAYRPGEHGNTLIETLGEGDFLGLLAFISPRGRAATVVAETEVEYFEIAREIIERLIQEHPTVERGLYRFVRHRLLMSLLAEMPVVRALRTDQREAMARRFQQRVFVKGEELVYEGAEFNTMFMLLKGRVAVGPEAASGDVEEPIVQLEAGDLVGCLAAQAGEGADVVVQALEDGTCLVIPHKVFEDLALVYPSLQSLRQGLDEERCMISKHLYSIGVGLKAEKFVVDDD